MREERKERLPAGPNFSDLSDGSSGVSNGLDRIRHSTSVVGTLEVRFNCIIINRNEMLAFGHRNRSSSGIRGG